MEVSHWKGMVSMSMKFSPWPAPEVVKMTIFCAAILWQSLQNRDTLVRETESGRTLWSHCKHAVYVIMTITLYAMFDKFRHSPCLPLSQYSYIILDMPMSIFHNTSAQPQIPGGYLMLHTTTQAMPTMHNTEFLHQYSCDICQIDKDECLSFATTTRVSSTWKLHHRNTWSIGLEPTELNATTTVILTNWLNVLYKHTLRHTVQQHSLFWKHLQFGF